MVLLDSNLFVIDRFFPRDVHHGVNNAFLQSLPHLEAGLSIFTLLELCGIASFNLATKELKMWLSDFPSRYSVRVLNPYGIGSEESLAWFRTFLKELSEHIVQKMTFGDAVLLQEAERYAVAAIITWNAKDFSRRTSIPVLTPADYSESNAQD